MGDPRREQNEQFRQVFAAMVPSVRGKGPDLVNPVVHLIADWVCQPSLDQTLSSSEQDERTLGKLRENKILAVATLDLILNGLQRLIGDGKKKGVAIPDLISLTERSLQRLQRRLSDSP